MADLSGDLSAGHYTATATVYLGRRNLFDLRPGYEHQIGTLVSGSKSSLQRYDEDCDKIVRGLAMLDANADLLQAMHEIVAATQTSVPDAQAANRASEIAMRAIAAAEGKIDAAIAKVEGH